MNSDICLGGLLGGLLELALVIVCCKFFGLNIGTFFFLGLALTNALLLIFIQNRLLALANFTFLLTYLLFSAITFAPGYFPQ